MKMNTGRPVHYQVQWAYDKSCYWLKKMILCFNGVSMVSYVGSGLSVKKVNSLMVEAFSLMILSAVDAHIQNA